MPSRVIREALLESDRWLSLAHPVERLAYVALLLRVDDLGTCDASDGQLVRLWRDVCNIKGRDDALKLLHGLVDADLVRTYEAEGKRFLFLPRFRQRFRARTFLRPPPPDSLLQDEPDVRENTRQIKERTVQMPDMSPSGDGRTPDACPARAPVVVGVVVGEVENHQSSATPTPDRAGDEGSIPDCPQQQLIALYAKHLPMLTQPRVWDGQRARDMRARWKQCARPTDTFPGYRTIEEGLRFWDRFFAIVAQSRVLTEGITTGGRTWTPDLPWLMKASNFAKVIEGKYHQCGDRVP